MKKRIISLLLVLCLCAALLPTAVFADGIASDHIFNLSFSGDCNTANTQTVYLKDYLPSNAIVTGFVQSTLPNIAKSTSYAYRDAESANVDDAYFTYTTREHEEPVDGTFFVTASTSNYGDYKFLIHITLTGKYFVDISANRQNALYDGRPHEGYRNLKGTLTTSKKAYTGDYEFAYAKEDGTALSGAPSEIGNYTVTISIPESNENYKHKETLTLNFSILKAGDADAQYQTEANGAWINGTFEQAIENVYEGGTVKLLRNVTLDKTTSVGRKMTITSADANTPCCISTNINGHAYLLSITNEVKLENVIVDGGSNKGITATRAAIAVNGGKLTLGSDAVVQNNNNTTVSGVGGGVCVISGELTLDGGTIIGNTGYFGGGVGMVGGTFYAKSGTITGNTAEMGGGISVWELGAADEQYNTYGTLHLSGTVAVTGNSAISYAGGIQCSNAGKIYLSGSPTINRNTSKEEENGGIYLDGNPDDGFAIVKVNEKLSNTANVSFYSWGGSVGFVLAEPIDGYAITADDVGAMHYDGNYGIKLTDDNKAVLTDVGVYKITFDANGGNIISETAKTAEGKLAVLPMPTRNGYTFDGWFTEPSDGEQLTADNVYTEDTTIYAHWTAKPEESDQSDDNGLGGLIAILDDVPFVDVSENHYFYDAVKWAYHSGITGGTDAWHFSPDAGCTRAQIVTFLWRAAGCPSATYLGNFSDVDADSYYATAVAWAVENGITNGTSATTFSPEAVCTRADAVTFLYRAFGRNPNYTANFTDVPANAYFADAVAWAAENNVTGGTGNGKFSPNDTCSRAQIVTFLYRTLG